MASESGKRKEVLCHTCKKEWTKISLYAKDSTATCAKCKRKTKSSTKTHSWLAQPEVIVPLTEQQVSIRQAVRDEMDVYGIWEWLQVDNLDIKMTYLNELGEQGWKFAFATDKGIAMHRLKDSDSLLKRDSADSK